MKKEYKQCQYFSGRDIVQVIKLRSEKSSPLEPGVGYESESESESESENEVRIAGNRPE